MLINAVKDVASALGDLIQATKAASGKSINDPSMNHLKDSAKVRKGLLWLKVVNLAEHDFKLTFLFVFQKPCKYTSYYFYIMLFSLNCKKSNYYNCYVLKSVM